MIDRTASASCPRTSETDREHDAPVVPTKAKPRDAFEGAAISAVADRRADESLRMFAANTATASALPPNRRDDVLYVGMNMDTKLLGKPQTEEEARALVGMTKGHSKRIERPTNTVVENAGASFDTKTSDGCKAFARSLALAPAQTARIENALMTNPEGAGRTELALIAKAWSEGEHGATLPGRLVLSGHCSGSGIYDDVTKGDLIRFDSLREVARAMPKASGQIEDVMISACFSGKEADAKAWAETFPNMKSLWAYGGATDAHSPGGATAIEHIRVWEQATRGDRVPLETERIHALPMHDHISTWTAVGGYRNAM